MLETYITIAIAVLAVVAGYFAIRYGYKEQVMKVLFYLVTKAEKQLGGGTGELKFAAVTTWLYERFPLALRFFFTTKQVDELIELAVQKMKEYLEKNSKAAELKEV